MSMRFIMTFEWIESRIADLAPLSLLAMMGIVTTDVVMRYALSSPLSWSYDLVSMYLMPAIIFSSMAIVQRRRHHVNVNLLYLRLSVPVQRVADMISVIGSGGVLALVAFFSGRRAWTAYVNHEVVSGLFEWPTWIGPALLTLGSILFIFRVIVDLVAIAGGLTLHSSSGQSDHINSVEPH